MMKRSKKAVSDDSVVTEAAQSIVNGEGWNGQPISLVSFRDLYNRVNGSEDGSDWIILLICDEMIIRLRSQPQTLIVVSDKPEHFYSREDLDFVCGRTEVLGTTSGKLGIFQFIRESFLVSCSVFILLAMALSYFFTSYLPPTSLQTLSSSILTMMSVFIPVFTVFTLNSVHEDIYGLVADGSYYLLAQGDKYIAVIGLSSLVSGVVGAVICATYSAITVDQYYSLPHIAQACCSAASISLSGFSFYLVITYHFNRHRQLQERLMARKVLNEELQDRMQ